MFYVELENFSSERRNVFIKPMIETLDKWLYNLPRNYRRRFTPYDFSKLFEVPQIQVEHLFLDLVQSDIFTIRYAICCNHCKDGKEIYDTIDDAMDAFDILEKECEFCGEDIEYYGDNIYPIFTSKPNLTLNRESIKKPVSGNNNSSFSEYGSSLPELIEHCSDFYNDDAPEIKRLKTLLRKKVR